MKPFLIGLLSCMAISATSPLQDDPKSLSLDFGVYQSEKATVMYKKFTPVLEALQDDLEHRLGRSVDIRLTIFKSYDEGIDALAKGEMDFVRFGPASYITAKTKQKTIDLLAMEQENGEKHFKGVIIVKKDSPVKTIADLRGKSFAFGDPNSTIGRYLCQAELVKAGIYKDDLSNSKFLNRHDTVAAAVELGDFDAGSVQMSTFEKANEKNTLRILVSFDNVTKPWVSRAGLDPKIFQALQQSLFALKDPAVLKELKVSGFTPTTDDEYAFVREGMKQAYEFEHHHVGN